jgi:hypothetical protein
VSSIDLYGNEMSRTEAIALSDGFGKPVQTNESLMILLTAQKY